MNDDIVTRLRNEVCECGYAASFNELHKCLRCEAIDEIERLRYELSEAQNEYQQLWQKYAKAIK